MELAETFLKSKGLSHADVQLTFNRADEAGVMGGGYSHSRVMACPRLAFEWEKYHRSNATLRLVCKRCNPFVKKNLAAS